MTIAHLSLWLRWAKILQKGMIARKWVQKMSFADQKQVSSSIFKKVEIVKVYGRSVIIIPNTSLQIRFATLSMFNSSDSYFVFSVHDGLILCSIYLFFIIIFFCFLLFIILNYVHVVELVALNQLSHVPVPYIIGK